ncbi:enolase family protein [Histomonas meleagridis]|uniref:enolase family protein n=1 Tax=Histomonas meleagridis TaxID=135588 RepID=UPI00355A5D2D|nr:enolase family protein [Histomonas meleagridis]KAH0803741.1 enolase family protein [Histomonas meleagridis]
MGDEETKKCLKAIDYVKEHCIEQKIEQFIGQVVHERPSDPFGVFANQFASQSKQPTITCLKAREVIVSTGGPSLCVEVYANVLGQNNLVGKSVAPVGISVSIQEQKPLVDSHSSRYFGLGIQNTFSLVDLVSKHLQQKEFTDIVKFDNMVKKCLEDKTGISNVLTAISFSLAKASSYIMQKPLFLYLYESFFPLQSADNFIIPTPIFTVFEGGKHSEDSPIPFESVNIIPKSGISFAEQLRICSEVSHQLKHKIFANGRHFSIGKMGGLVYRNDISTSLSILEEAITESGYKPGIDITISIDCAASTFYLSDIDTPCYQIIENNLTSAQLIQFYIDLMTKHPSISMINDGISDVDNLGWDLMRDALIGKVKLFGGDVYSSQSTLARKGLKKKWTDGILIQPLQVGCLSDAADTAILFKQRGKLVCVGRRCGETCESLIADFAVAIQSEYLMAGGAFSADGTAKYNQMLRIEEYIKKEM